MNAYMYIDPRIEELTLSPSEANLVPQLILLRKKIEKVIPGCYLPLVIHRLMGKLTPVHQKYVVFDIRNVAGSDVM
jgi:hypothetical protein